MTILIYILLGMFASLMLAASVVIVFRAGEKELLTKYDYITEETEK